jgi:biotin carboxylase
MAHLLLLEAPGGNDFDVLDEAIALGHSVSFFTSDRALYESNGTHKSHLGKAARVVEIRPFSYEALLEQAKALHVDDPIDGLLCLIDIRIIEAARLAAALGLPFLNPETATLMRDKFSVRQMLAAKGICQPRFALARSNEELRDAVAHIGLPVVVKPCDGYGSQNTALLLTPDDLNPLLSPFDSYFPCRVEYGLGVLANNRMLVEQYIPGRFIGCDTFTVDGEHVMLGVNEKLMYPPPSCAIRGSCFPSDRFDEEAIRNYVFSILDALNFDCGAAHTEIQVTDEGLFLVEVNPRLVGAKLPRLLNAALGKSVHRDLIELHLGTRSVASFQGRAQRVAALRWVVADGEGTLISLTLPAEMAALIESAEMLKAPGEPVTPPYQNADRLGYVVSTGKTREQAEAIAEEFVARVRVEVAPSMA